jgi:transcription factor C subunit 3
VGTHFCIHKYLYERNPLWQQIRDEELQADQDFEKISRKRQSESEDEHGEEDDEPSAVDFEPIDARHLSSLPLVRARVIKLLKGSKNHMHVCNNMLLTIVRLVI